MNCNCTCCWRNILAGDGADGPTETASVVQPHHVQSSELRDVLTLRVTGASDSKKHGMDGDLHPEGHDTART